MAVVTNSLLKEFGLVKYMKPQIKDTPKEDNVY